MIKIKDVILFMKGKTKYIVASYCAILFQQVISNYYFFQEKSYSNAIIFSRYLYDIPYYVFVYLFGLIPIINCSLKKEVITKYSNKLLFDVFCLKNSYIYSLCFALFFNFGSFIMCFITVGANCLRSDVIIYHIISVVMNSLGWTIFGLAAFVIKSRISNPLISVIIEFMIFLLIYKNSPIVERHFSTKWNSTLFDKMLFFTETVNFSFILRDIVMMLSYILLLVWLFYFVLKKTDFIDKKVV